MGRKKDPRRPTRKLSDQEAQQVLSLANAACRQFYPNFSRHQKDELIGAAVVGLVEWWDKFDETKATRRTWAIWKAHHLMQDYLRVEARNHGLGRHGKRKYRVVSTDELITVLDDDYGGITYAGTLVGDEDVEINDSWLTQPLLYAALDSLPDRLRSAMILYANGNTLAEIGELFGVTESRASQMVTQARKRLSIDGRVLAAAA